MNSTRGLLASALCTLSAATLANSSDFGEGLQNFAPSQVLDNTDGARDHWQGIGRLTIEQNNCTATLLDTRDGLELLAAPAYVLTAGHCLGLTNGNIVTDSPIRALSHSTTSPTVPGSRATR